MMQSWHRTKRTPGTRKRQNLKKRIQRKKIQRTLNLQMDRKNLKKSFRWKLFHPVPIKAESTEEKTLPVRQHLTSLRSRLLRNLPDRLRSRQPDLPVRRRFPMFLLLMRNWMRRSSLFPERSIRDLKLRELWQLFLR